MSWFGIGATVVSAGTQIYSARQTQKATEKALQSQQQIAADLKYAPIDIDKLRANASKAAIENATASLATERELQPQVADVRQELSKQISDNLRLGNTLPPDVINQVNTAGRVIGGRSGVGSGGTVPLTAALLGESALGLGAARRKEAGALLNANPLQPSGLDPGAVASLEVAQNAAMNDFNLEKAGVNSDLAEGEAKARTSQIGSQVGLISSLSNLLGTAGKDYTASRAGIGEKMTEEQFRKIYGKP